MVRPRLDRMFAVNTSDGAGWAGSSAALLSMLMERSTASSVRGWPVRSTSIISVKSCLTSATSAGEPVAVTSFPRTWMSAPGKPSSITRRSESAAPSRVTIGCFSGMTIRVLVDASSGRRCPSVRICGVSVMGRRCGLPHPNPSCRVARALRVTRVRRAGVRRSGAAASMVGAFAPMCERFSRVRPTCGPAAARRRPAGGQRRGGTGILARSSATTISPSKCARASARWPARSG